MYTLRFIYPTVKQHTPSQHYQDSITHCATLDLYVDHGIESFQMSSNEVGFTQARDRTLAILVLSSRTQFTVQAI
jgi:hypothetical protein